MARTRPEINASSMADIAFLLLIFFLVSTTMNVDSGIQRTLPPIADNDKDDKGVDMNQRNLMLVNINLYNQIGVKGVPIDITQLKDRAKEFIMNPANNEDFSEREKPKEPINLFPDVEVSKGVISLQCDRGTSYDTYLQVQNELTKAYNELRKELSLKRFNKEFSELSPEERTAVTKVIPTRISEAEPRNVKR